MSVHTRVHTVFSLSLVDTPVGAAQIVLTSYFLFWVQSDYLMYLLGVHIELDILNNTGFLASLSP